jgi:CubicO group peptidase (beta-lactamase class C family)
MRLSWQLTTRRGKITPVPHTGPVTDLTIELDPAEAGLDHDRLKRVDAHLARYVDDGRLAGWLLTISRHGRLAHVARCGSRDLEAGLPVTDDTLWRIYSMTKPVTSVAAMILLRGGRPGAHRPGQRLHPRL